MQYLQERLYLVTTAGVLACLDVSEAAVQAAGEGRLPRSRDLQAPPVGTTPASTTLETTTDASQGVVLECFSEGGRLRLRVLSAGYDTNLRVQFPHNIRQEHTRYLVDAVRLAVGGGFYRVHGNIKKLV
jgi:hypothetical protein